VSGWAIFAIVLGVGLIVGALVPRAGSAACAGTSSLSLLVD
jgi:hypothetical protein